MTEPANRDSESSMSSPGSAVTSTDTMSKVMAFTSIPGGVASGISIVPRNITVVPQKRNLLSDLICGIDRLL